MAFTLLPSLAKVKPLLNNQVFFILNGSIRKREQNHSFCSLPVAHFVVPSAKFGSDMLECDVSSYSIGSFFLSGFFCPECNFLILRNYQSQLQNISSICIFQSIFSISFNDFQC